MKRNFAGFAGRRQAASRWAGYRERSERLIFQFSEIFAKVSSS